LIEDLSRHHFCFTFFFLLLALVFFQCIE